MEVTAVRIKLMSKANGGNSHILAFAAITVDDAISIREIKIVRGSTGIFVGMPDRKLCDKCEDCGNKNHLRARFCSECGKRLASNRARLDTDGRPAFYADVAHPINQKTRTTIETAVLAAYRDELERSKRPGYTPSWDACFSDGGDKERHAGIRADSRPIRMLAG